MFSRLSAQAAVFAIVTTAVLAFAVNLTQSHRAHDNAPIQVVQLERVVVTGHHVLN
ncbi:hypothetical protein [Piscinibacter sp.]|jgi:hypothetical protein|uniref:hypothetical protein n=1 Tax=Piscinibacter sp. TaxID=1903157 RepID=UPI002F3EAF63